MTDKPWTIRFEGYLPVDEGMAERLKRICADIEKIPTSAMEIAAIRCLSFSSPHSEMT